MIQSSLLGACAFVVLQSEVNHGLLLGGAEVVLSTRQCNSVPHLCVCIDRAAGTSAKRKRVCVCGGNGVVVSVCSGVCTREGCGGVKVGESVDRMLCVRIG